MIMAHQTVAEVWKSAVTWVSFWSLISQTTTILLYCTALYLFVC